MNEDKLEGYTPEEYRAMLRLFDVKCADTAGNDSSPSERLAVIKWLFTYTQSYEEIHRQVHACFVSFPTSAPTFR